MKYLFNKQSKDKKECEVLNKYREIVNSNRYKTKEVLLLVPNNATKIRYERELDFEFSEELNINTYIGFIKKEIIKYWPILCEKCSEIKVNSISPVFIQSSLSQYLMIDKVSKKRIMEGYFEDITGTDKNIANSILNNLSKGTLGLVDLKVIGEKIYLSKKNRDQITKFSYSQMDELIDEYVSLLLSHGMLDNSLCVYLYNEYLLKEMSYIDSLKKGIKYVIVGSLEASSNAEVDLVKILSPTAKSTYLYLDRSGDFSVFNNTDMKYIFEEIISDMDKDVQEKFLNYRLDISHIGSLSVDINLNESSQLYSEMIDEVCIKVCGLIDEGITPKDIAIISPVNNAVLDYQIKSYLEDRDIDIINTKIDNKLVDYKYSNALLVATCLYFDEKEYIKEDDMLNFIEVLLDVSKIKALNIYRNKDSKIQEVLDYITKQREKNLKINEFLIEFYIEMMLSLKEGRKNVSLCKKIINESENFIESLKTLKIDANEKQIFIKGLKSTINDFYFAYDLANIKESNKVIICTPYSYISSSINRKIQIWVDIGSNAWSMKIEKDISNFIVLRKSFEEKKIYTDLMEEEYKKYYLYNMMYSILESAKSVYAYKSDYTVNGYMQESMLYGILLRLVEDRGIYNE